MPNPPPGSHRTNISINLTGDNIININGENFREIVRTALGHDIQGVVSDLEVSYNSHRLGNAGDGVEVSITIDYSMREFDNDTHAARRNGQNVQDSNAEAVLWNTEVRWAVERADRAVHNANQRREIQIQQRQNEPARPTLFSAAATLLGFLPVVNVENLAEDKRSCPVCTEHFSATDKPILIKCNHVVGRACIEQWILSGRNSCPLCRAKIFEPARGV